MIAHSTSVHTFSRAARAQLFRSAFVATAFFAIGLAFPVSGASGSELVPTALDLPILRPAMLSEGLLAHLANPYAQNPTAPVRSGEEYTGWIDVRNPALAGPGDASLGFDRYDRQLSQATTILKDRNNLLPQSVDVTRDLNYANTLYAREAGVSLIERSTRTYTSPAAGQAGSFDFPLSHGLGNAGDPGTQFGLPKEESDIMLQNVG